MKTISLSEMENYRGGICATFPGNTDNSVFGDGCFTVCGLGQLLGAVPFPVACPA